MRRQDALFVATCVGSIAFCVVFVLPHFTEQSVPWYYPLEHRWELTAKPTGLAMDFYGRLFYALGAWAIGVVASLAVTRKVTTLSPKVASLLVAWAIALIVLVMMYYAWTLAFRVPVAMPIPDWYVPR